MCDIIFENTKGIYAEATVQVSIVLVMEGELASETENQDTKIMYQFEPKCNFSYTPDETAGLQFVGFEKFRKLRRKICV